jgi:omega-amidase
MDIWRIGLLQMDIAHGEPDVNFQRAEQQMAQIAMQNPDVVVLPEMWNTGYDLPRIQEIADPGGERTRRLMSGLAKQYGIHIVAGSVAAKQDGGVYNTTYVFDRSGSLVSEYRKIHLFGLMQEDRYLGKGNASHTFLLDGRRMTSIICYDLRFPELLRKNVLQGAAVAFIPAEWPDPRLSHWRHLLIARAIENQMFVAGCNRVGMGGNEQFFGHSMVVDPWGKVLFEAGRKETLQTVEIDLSLVQDVRNRIPVLRDRRPELY